MAVVAGELEDVAGGGVDEANPALGVHHQHAGEHALEGGFQFALLFDHADVKLGAGDHGGGIAREGVQQGHIFFGEALGAALVEGVEDADGEALDHLAFGVLAFHHQRNGKRVAHVQEGDVLFDGARIGHRVVNDHRAPFAEDLAGGALGGAHAEDADLLFREAEGRPLGHQLAALLIVQHQDGLLRPHDHGHFLHEAAQRGFEFGGRGDRRAPAAGVLQFRLQLPLGLLQFADLPAEIFQFRADLLVLTP